MSSDPFGQAAGTPESFIANIDAARTPQQRAQALEAYENFFKGGASASAVAPEPGAAPAGLAPPSAPASGDAIKAAMEKARAATTPQARQRAVEELEALHRSNSAAATDAPQAAPEGFEPPRSPLEYHLVPPMGVDIQNDEALGALKGQLFDAGIPADLAGQAFANATRLHVNGATASPEAYDSALAQCKAALERQFGADAKSIAIDGVAYLNALADKQPALDEAVTLMLADPWAIATAANLQRAMKGRR